MSEGLPKETQAELKRFTAAVEKIGGLVDSFCSRDPKQVDAELSPVQRAQTHLAVAQALQHVFLLYLRVHGLDTPGHPVHKEAERLKVYGRKVRRLESADYLARTRPSLEVDVAAANRFIDHAIPDLSQEQRQALKQAGKDHAEQKQLQSKQQQQQQQPHVKGGLKRKQPESGGKDSAEMARAFLQQAFGKPGASVAGQPQKQQKQ